MPKTEYPQMIKNDLIEEDSVYIVAGFGVVMGKKANKKIWESGHIAVWTEMKG
jgi:hypothetical protein